MARRNPGRVPDLEEHSPWWKANPRCLPASVSFVSSPRHTPCHRAFHLSAAEPAHDLQRHGLPCRRWWVAKPAGTVVLPKRGEARSPAARSCATRVIADKIIAAVSFPSRSRAPSAKDGAGLCSHRH